MTHLFIRENPRRARLLREPNSQLMILRFRQKGFKQITLILRVFRGRQIAFLLQMTVLDHAPLEEIQIIEQKRLL